MITLTSKKDFSVTLAEKEFHFKAGIAQTLTRQEAFEIFERLNGACLDVEVFFNEPL